MTKLTKRFRKNSTGLKISFSINAHIKLTLKYIFIYSLTDVFTFYCVAIYHQNKSLEFSIWPRLIRQFMFTLRVRTMTIFLYHIFATPILLILLSSPFHLMTPTPPIFSLSAPVTASNLRSETLALPTPAHYCSCLAAWHSNGTSNNPLFILKSSIHVHLIIFLSGTLPNLSVICLKSLKL